MRAVVVRWQTHSVILLSIAVAVSPGCTRRPPVLGDFLTGSGEGQHHADLVRAKQVEADIARAGLLMEPTPLPPAHRHALLSRINAEAGAIRTKLKDKPPTSEVFAALNEHFFGPAGFSGLADLTAPENSSLAAVLDNRRGTCVGLAIVYLALAQRLDLHAHAVATPVHLLIRVRVGGSVRNVELLEAGREIDDDTYRRRYKIDEASIAAGAFMRELTNDELIAHLLSNQAVAFSKQGRLKEALRRYGRALKMHPKLVAVWYNRGIDLMNAGRLKNALASFNRAIELYPSDAQAHNNRGLTRLKLGDRDGAAADFRRALQIEPSLTEAEENLKRLLSVQPNPR